MSFLVPSFLLALISIGIPILIHLFYFKKYKKAEFTNVHFLSVLKEEANSRSKLKNILILLCRIFAFVFLVLAFAQPFFNDENIQSNSRKAISIYLDNSFSMDNESSYGKLVNEGKIIAKQIVRDAGVDAEIQILSNEFHGRSQLLLDQSSALEQLSALQVTAECRSYNSVLARQLNALRKSQAKQKEVYLISDFQTSIGDLEYLNVDSTVSINWIPLKGNEMNNVTIDSVWLASPFVEQNQAINLVAKFYQSNDSYEGDVNVNLKINGEHKALGAFKFNDQTSAFDTITFSLTEPGLYEGELSIEDHPIQFDDRYFFSFEINSELKVLSINGENSGIYLSTIFENNNNFRYEEQAATGIDFGSIEENDVIILNQLSSISSGLRSALKSYVKKGGSVIIIPSINSDLIAYQNLSKDLQIGLFQTLNADSSEVNQINYYSEIFKHVFEKKDARVDLPTVFQYYSILDDGNSFEPLLQMRNRKNLVNAYQKEKSMIYLFGVPLDNAFGNLQVHSIFVPMIYNMVLKSSLATRLSYTIGEDEFVEHKRSNNEQEVLRITSSDFEIIPEQKNFNNKSILVLHNQIKEPGFYQIKEGEKVDKVLAFNYSRMESNLSFYNAEELEEISSKKGTNIINAELGNDGTIQLELNNTSSLWKLCIIFVLVFLGLEMFLIKRL